MGVSEATPYRINGITAPQVRPDPLGTQLQNQLQTLKKDLERRSQSATLQQAIETGLLNNPNLAAAYNQIQQSQWTLIAARRQWYPTLNATTGSSSALLGQSFSTNTGGGYNTFNTTTYSNTTGSGVGLSLNWSFFDATRGPTINVASESLRQQQLLFDVSARNLVLQLQQAYFNLQQQRLLISSYDEILVNTDRQVRIAEAKFNNGLVSVAEVEQIRTQQYTTLSDLINLHRQLVDGAALLARAMALPPGTLVLPADALTAMGSWEVSLNDTIAQALRLREEIQASLAASASASWSATAAFNRYWPSFNLAATGGYGTTNATSGLPGISSTNNAINLNWNGGVGLGFSWQLFDGGINAAQAQANKAQARQLQNTAAVQRLTITQEVEQAYSAYLTSQLALQSTNAQALSARKSVLAAQERFNVGVADMTTVVQTLNAAINAANAYAAAVSAYNTAVASLYRTSAQWPTGSKSLLDQRVGVLKRQ